MFVGQVKIPKVSKPKSLFLSSLPVKPLREKSYTEVTVIGIMTVIVLVLIGVLIYFLKVRRSRESPPLWHIPHLSVMNEHHHSLVYARLCANPSRWPLTESSPINMRFPHFTDKDTNTGESWSLDH